MKTRDELIAEIMRQVCEATEDEAIRRDVEFKLRLTAGPVLREIVAADAVAQAVETAKARAGACLR